MNSNMKLFDYKFLILLALTLVVYFIHKEVEKLRARIVKLESNCKPIIKLEQVLEEVNQEKNNTLVYNEQHKQNIYSDQPKQNVQDEQIKQEDRIDLDSIVSTKSTSSLSSTKKISLDIKAESVGEIIVQQSVIQQSVIQQNVIQQSVIQQSVNDDNTTTDIISNNKHDSETSSSQHLAIYSNDNEISNENNSLLDSELVLLKEPSQDQNKEVSQEKEDVVIITHEKHENHEKENLDYDKMKINELKKIVEDLGLNVTKKVNGQYKPKNKQELLNEIKNKK